MKKHLLLSVEAFAVLSACGSILHSEDIGRVSSLAGEWQMSTISGRYGSYQIQVNATKTIKAEGRGKVVFSDNVQTPSGTPFPSYEAVVMSLRFDTSQIRYLFDFVLGGRKIDSLVLVLDQANRLKGAGEMQVGESRLPVEVEVAFREDGSEWDVFAPDRSQPAEKRKDKPLEAYNFKFSKPKPAPDTKPAK